VRVLAAAVLLLGLVACTGEDGPAIATPPATAVADLAPCPEPGTPTTAGQALPDLTLPCLGAGGEVPLRRLTGTPMVVNLWASWCGPCREELPALARLDTDAGSRLRVLGVASQDVPANSAAYASDNALPFPSLEDRAGDLLRGLQRRGLPVTAFVAADGAIAHVYQGRPLTDATLRALVREKLGIDV
jgi:cytochrome c biogenesis protein CcmG, thiol:disulfide interchange protein DsbE